MMVYDEITYLRCNFSPIPSHNQHLANGPGRHAQSATSIIYGRP